MFIMKCTNVFSGTFLHWGGGGSRGGGYVGGSFHGGFYHEGREFAMKGAQDFLALSKKKTTRQ